MEECICLPQDGVAVLVCCAIEGFHPLVKYEWKKDGVVMQGETYPLVFVEVPGKVVCTVTGRDVQAECSFEVVGKWNTIIINKWFSLLFCCW